jgi:CheY-like chemotaxis protein
VVVSDVAMPIMDDPATIRALTKINPAIKIIASSGRSTRESLADAGTKYFLTKPYTAETLLRVLRQILDEG